MQAHATGAIGPLSHTYMGDGNDKSTVRGTVSSSHTWNRERKERRWGREKRECPGAIVPLGHAFGRRRDSEPPGQQPVVP